jgi:chemotaxis protein MotB
MLKKTAILFIITITLNSCVSKKVYQELETKFNNLRSSNSALVEEKDDLLVAKKALEADLEKLNNDYDSLKTQKEILDNEFASLQSKHKNLDESYNVLSTQSSKKLAEQSQKNQELLVQLEEKERKLAIESDRLAKLQNELAERSNQINELQGLIDAKEAQMQQLKNPDINVLIEGHTDNVPYTGATVIDNWDLSVKRATAIVRILQNKGVNPTQITAAGRSEYVMVGSNATPEGKAKNRRIEIILAPNLDEISKLLNN